MATIRAYHRPRNLEEALTLLTRPGVDSAPLAGGTVVNNLGPRTHEELIDLQALDLTSIEHDGTTIEVGAMVTLDQLTGNGVIPPILQDLARREAASTIRNAATIGGTIGAADGESGLLAGLLAANVIVVLTDTTGRSPLALADVLADSSVLTDRLITSVVITPGGIGFAAGTSRTPADTPIVQIVGILSDAGDIRMAATGVAATPMLIDPENLADLDPPSDFRGSADYRRHLVRTLTDRVLTLLEGDT